MGASSCSTTLSKPTLACIASCGMRSPASAAAAAQHAPMGAQGHGKVGIILRCRTFIFHTELPYPTYNHTELDSEVGGRDRTGKSFTGKSFRFVPCVRRLYARSVPGQTVKTKTNVFPFSLFPQWPFPFPFRRRLSLFPSLF